MTEPEFQAPKPKTRPNDDTTGADRLTEDEAADATNAEGDRDDD